MLEVLTAIFWFIVFPIADFKFLVGQIEQIYLARTFDQSLFQSKKNEAVPTEVKNTHLEIETHCHYTPQLSGFQKLSLFCATKMKICLCWTCCYGHKQRKLVRLYTLGSKRLDEERSLVNLIKTVRNLKYTVETNLYDSNEKFKADHNSNGVIDLEHQSPTIRQDQEGTPTNFERVDETYEAKTLVNKYSRNSTFDQMLTENKGPI